MATKQAVWQLPESEYRGLFERVSGLLYVLSVYVSNQINRSTGQLDLALLAVQITQLEKA